MNILIAVDGSAWTQRMLEYVSAQEEWLGSRHKYTFLYVIAELPVHVASMASGGAEAVQRYYDEELRKVLEPICRAFAQKGMIAETVGKIGAAAETIAEVAQSGKYDLLVMGSRGHGALAGLVLGSVATRVLALCQTPMLLIR